jgi:hypothetical protein
MSLTPGEQETLAEMESQLRRTAPALVAMFTFFAEARQGELPGREVLPQRGLAPTRPARKFRIRAIMLLAACAALMITCIVLGALAGSGTSSPPVKCGLGASPDSVYSPGCLSLSLPRHLQQVIE